MRLTISHMNRLLLALIAVSAVCAALGNGQDVPERASHAGPDFTAEYLALLRDFTAERIAIGHHYWRVGEPTLWIGIGSVVSTLEVLFAGTMCNQFTGICVADQ